MDDCGYKLMSDKIVKVADCLMKGIQQELDELHAQGKLETIKKSMMENVENNPAWQTLPAVKEKKVYFLPQELFLLSPGIHYPEVVETMAKLVYPDKFN